MHKVTMTFHMDDLALLAAALRAGIMHSQRSRVEYRERGDGWMESVCERECKHMKRLLEDVLRAEDEWYATA